MKIKERIYIKCKVHSGCCISRDSYGEETIHLHRLIEEKTCIIAGGLGKLQEARQVSHYLLIAEPGEEGRFFVFLFFVLLSMNLK